MEEALHVKTMNALGSHARTDALDAPNASYFFLSRINALVLRKAYPKVLRGSTRKTQIFIPSLSAKNSPMEKGTTEAQKVSNTKA